ncbi:hypothetical protein JTE90_018485 [Oedothorax gibbosus]|uniref:HMG box domain-containing protein n=1 Tax=Oedothorax gibbosus TaxID=931172 RepID=A0AAV6UFW6_9ARAC|nr:hypothetical protein JTE90_018485 [Oedothorax gibbosus]
MPQVSHQKFIINFQALPASDEAMDTPQISRSGRVLKKSAKVKEMEDFDINELDVQGRPKKRSRPSDETEDPLSDDKQRVAPIKIPKISLNISNTPKRPPPQIQPRLAPGPAKGKFVRDMSPDGSKESDSSSMSSESSSSPSSSSDESDVGEGGSSRVGQVIHNSQHNPHEKVVVEQYRQFDPPVSFADHSSEIMDPSDDETSDSALVIAEESSDSFVARSPKVAPIPAKKRPPPKKDAVATPKKPVAPKKKPPARTPAAKKEKQPGKSKPLTAYMLWCNENRKRIATASGTVGFGNIGKKLGETWQALPDKEKMAWRRKAKRLALKSSGGLISTGPAAAETSAAAKQLPSRAAASTSAEDALKNLADSGRVLGTSAIDSAAYLKLLGDSLSLIGQRLTEHEGQLAVSGIFSVLLDTILCVVGPLLCLTSESPVLSSLPQETSRSTLDSIAYFMPGL